MELAIEKTVSIIDVCMVSFLARDSRKAAKAQYPNHIVMTDMGPVVEVSGDDAKVASAIMGKFERTEIMLIPKQRLEEVMASIHKHDLDIVLVDWKTGTASDHLTGLRTSVFQEEPVRGELCMEKIKPRDCSVDQNPDYFHRLNKRYLFRGKRVDDQVWVQGYLSKGRLKYYEGNTLQPCIDREENGVMLSSVVDPNTIDKCTGLRDTNGALIFEGDIVRAAIPEIDASKLVVKFMLNNQQTMLMHDDTRVADLDYFTSRYIEVIGNVHDGANERSE